MDNESTNAGKTYIIDIGYLNVSYEGFRYVVIFCCRTTSYISFVPLKSITVIAIIEAVHLFLGFLPFPDALLSDFGPEMGLQLTKALAKLGIKHVGRIPLRSNQQGAAESSIRILKCMLHKLFALPTYGGRDDWVRLLLITVKNLNATHCYGAKL